MLPKLARWGGFTIAGWLAFFGALFLVGTFLSRSALSAASRMPESTDGHAPGVDAMLRRAYRVVLWLAGAFYWISLPLLAVLMVALGAGLVIGALYIGRIPI